MFDAQQIAREVCEVGQRMYDRRLVAGHDGNISVQLADNEVLCTPTRICKGRMQPEDLCTVNFSGEQIGGQRKASSEILLHLEILKVRPDVTAVVHCHPPHATAFALTGKPPHQGVSAEAELFLGEVPIAPYETPGTAVFAQTILPYVARTNVCLLANHGSVTYAESLEQAYCLTEMLDAYCEVLILASQVGPPQTLSSAKLEELTRLRVNYGLAPPQLAEKEK